MSLVILTEEPSMKVTLEALLPKLGIDPAGVTIIAHQGKSDLEQSIPRKLKAWKTPKARFLILRDNDRAPDCRQVKAQLARLAADAGKAGATTVRIVCQELEAWFLADRAALVAAGYLGAGKQPAFLRKDPDAISHPVREMEQLRPGYGKIAGARDIAPHLDLCNNRSTSFRSTVQALRVLAGACGQLPCPHVQEA
jgi:hypothetical protein